MPPTTRQKALQEARALVQIFGLNGFSFQHVADRVGIKKPSIYEHFKSKDDLAICIIKDWREKFLELSETVEVFSADQKIAALFEKFCIFADDKSKVCPLTAMTAEINGFSPEIRQELKATCDTQLAWLDRTIAQGQATGLFRTDLPCADMASFIIVLIFGGQMASRIRGNADSIKAVKGQALDYLKAKI